jgi:hypothetical protein
MDFKYFKQHLKQLLTENVMKVLIDFLSKFYLYLFILLLFFFGICRQCVKLYDL